MRPSTGHWSALPSDVAMLACTLGCDAVYGRGYVGVTVGGAIEVSPLVTEIPEVEAYVQDKLVGRTVTWWTPSREPYYAWHRTHTYKDIPPV